MVAVEEMWEKLPFIWNGEKMHWTMTRLNPNKVYISPGIPNRPDLPFAIGPIQEALISILDKVAEKPKQSQKGE